MAYWALLFLFFAVIAWASHRDAVRLKELRQSRLGYTESLFQADLAEQGVQREVAQEVWAQMGEQLGSDFPVQPADDLAQLYGIVDEDMEDLVESAARALGIATGDRLWPEPLSTVGDVAQALSRGYKTNAKGKALLKSFVEQELMPDVESGLDSKNRDQFVAKRLRKFLSKITGSSKSQ